MSRIKSIFSLGVVVASVVLSVKTVLSSDKFLESQVQIKV